MLPIIGAREWSAHLLLTATRPALDTPLCRGDNHRPNRRLGASYEALAAHTTTESEAERPLQDKLYRALDVPGDRPVGASIEQTRLSSMDDHELLFSPNVGEHLLTREWHIRRRYSRRLRLMQIPEDLRGWTVLDIGAWGGFFSFECERRGADRVLAIDRYIWDRDGMDTFLAQRERLHSKVEYRRLDAHEIDSREIGQFDLVLFLGVFYHLHTPLRALERIASVTRNLLICDTHVLLPFVHERSPLVPFFPGDERATGTPPEMCAIPTMECLRQMLAFVGFTQIEVKYSPSFRYWKKFVALVTNTPQSGRGIVHARS